MDYDGAYDHKNSRNGVLSPQYSQTAQGAYSPDSSAKLRKQWFQKNDLDCYNNNYNPSANKRDSFDSNYSMQENMNYAKANMSGDDFANYQREHNYESSDVDMREEANSTGMQADNDKPYWLKDDIPAPNEPYTANDLEDLPNQSNSMNLKQNPEWLGDQTQQKPPPHPSSYQPMRSDGSSRASDQPANQMNSMMHKRFSSNPLLNIKSPFANDYVHDGALVSENASAYGLRGGNNVQSVNNVHIKNNRLRTFRHQPSEMSKLLSFGYIKDQGGSGDMGDVGFSQHHQQMVKPDELQKTEMMQFAQQVPYKPTCIEKAESGSSIQSNQDNQLDMSRPSNLRDRSSSYGKKKLSFDEGRPEFFNIINKNEEPGAGISSIPNEGLFRMMGRDTRINFRRRKVDINAPILPGFLGSQMRR